MCAIFTKINSCLQLRMNFFCLGKDNVKAKANKQPFITKYYSNELNAMTKKPKEEPNCLLAISPQPAT